MARWRRFAVQSVAAGLLLWSGKKAEGWGMLFMLRICGIPHAPKQGRRYPGGALAGVVAGGDSGDDGGDGAASEKEL
jgi:hypothetical protein